jgi:hypothetical protein
MLNSQREGLSNRWAIFSLAAGAVAMGGLACPLGFQITPADQQIAALLAPAPQIPMGFYDQFGSIKSPIEARQIVQAAGLDPFVQSNFSRVGLVQVTPELIAEGRELFFKQSLGTRTSLVDILDFAGTFGRSPVDLFFLSFDSSQDPDGVFAFLRESALTSVFGHSGFTTNLQVKLTNNLRMGTHILPPGTVINTGLDIAAGAAIPVGFEGAQLSCALCHASVNPQNGEVVAGIPNTDLNIAFFLTLSSNTAAALLRLNAADFNPLDPKFPRGGRTIIDSTGASVQLPEPIAFERAVDDFIFESMPNGSFEAAPDSVSALTKIPDNFVFGEGGMGWDGGFQLGPFGGISAFSNAVHSFELNFLSVQFISKMQAGVDPEVYLGVILQHAGNPALRIPDGVRPSEWLAQNFPDAEREGLVQLAQFPEASLFSLNGLIASVPGKPFMHDVNALAAFQASLVCPPNRSIENYFALQEGSVERGAGVFLAAGCTSCHPAPYYTTGQVTSNDIIKASSARGVSRRGLEGRLVESVLPSFDQMVPLPASPNLLTLPPAPGTVSNLTLPPGLDTPAGGYKIIGLIGTYFKAPYLHDASIAVGPEALRLFPDGGWEIADHNFLGVPQTTLLGRPVSAANSLRALFDRDLRARVIANNRAEKKIARVNVDGAGHEFYIDPAAGFTYRQQTDLINFILALDDNPAAY